MTNELIFLLHTILISTFALSALYLGKEALVAFISIQCILANLFVVKQTTLFGLTATCSDAFSVGAVLGLNLLQEYFGREQAQKAIWVSFVSLIFYGIVSQLHLAYLPSSLDSMHCHFEPILLFMPRIIIASFIVYFFVQYLDALLYARLKNYFNGNYLVLRNYGSMMLSQLIDTILFSFLGLYGIVDNIIDIIIISYAIKVITILIATPWIALSKRVIFK